ncbi:FAD binding domain-containing protein [Epithele typhae]|uniref:FAD binding domain-containing protein n=1 Tax=Epithele typhae TaxID=378194 RepID=UPI002008204C|nr:FAD binding domain-containing protein [Epithele typhae]KAH9916722.1 FAD binding domain-containing protein [Epithele typhae]
MSATSDTIPVLIVGSGPSGLAAALTLAHNRVHFRIVEKLTEFHETSRGSGVQSRTLEVFKFLGIMDDILSTGTALPPMRSYKLPGGTEVEHEWMMLDNPEATPDRPCRNIMIDQYLTEGIMRKHLNERFGVQVELGTEPISIEQDDNRVSLTLKKTAQDAKGTTETVKAQFVIGADGAKGVMRKFIGATFEGENKDADGQVWAECHAEGVTNEFWHIWAQLDNFIISMRPKREKVNFHMGIVGQGWDPVDLVDPDKFVEFFYESVGRTDIKFSNMHTMTHWKPKMRMVNKFYEGRCFIVGDAAHIHSPTGDQGLVQDSFNLCWKLTLACKGYASPYLLASFEAERIHVVAKMLATTSNLHTHAVARASDAGANPNPDDPQDTAGLSQRRTDPPRMLDVNYHWSPAVVDARGTQGRSADALKVHTYSGWGPADGVCAGDRAFDIFRPTRHTVMVFVDGDAARMAEVVETVNGCTPPGVANIVVIDSLGALTTVDGAAEACFDKDGCAARNYHIEAKVFTVVVVRPDGYVGAFVYDINELKEYFAKVVAV